MPGTINLEILLLYLKHPPKNNVSQAENAELRQEIAGQGREMKKKGDKGQMDPMITAWHPATEPPSGGLIGHNIDSTASMQESVQDCRAIHLSYSTGAEGMGADKD